MMHSHLTRWIEAADARDVLLEGAMIHQFPENTPRQQIHLGLTIKTIASWWHRGVAQHLLVCGQGPAQDKPPLITCQAEDRR
jgi:hypothetical protein